MAMIKVAIEAVAADPDRVAGGVVFVKGLVRGLLEARPWPPGCLRIYAPAGFVSEMQWARGTVEFATVGSVPRRRLSQAILGLRGESGFVVHHTGGWGPLSAAPHSVLTVHDLFHGDDSPDGLSAWSHWRLIRRGVATAASVVAVSESVARQVQDRCSPRGEVRVIPHGAGLFQGRQEDALPYPLRDHLILVPGAEISHKRKELAVSAFDRVAGRFDRAELVLVGPKADGTAAVDAAIAQSPWRSRIRRAGRVTDDALRSLFRRSKVMVFPSRREGFGLPIVEAMLAGVPVVLCADASGVPPDLGAATIVAEPNTAALASAIVIALSNTSAALTAVANGLQASAHYTWGRAAASYLELYEDLSGQKRT